MPFLTLPGVDLWYEDTGGPGTPVIFLHAASGTSESWVHQLPAFTAAGYRCITYDRRTWDTPRPPTQTVSQVSWGTIFMDWSRNSVWSVCT